MKLLNIENIIKEKELYSEYQPLMSSSDDSIFAYEAFIRSAQGINPRTLFQDARNNNNLYKLDTSCVTQAIENYPCSYLGKQFLFINIFPSTIIHNEFENFIDNLLLTYANIRGCVVFEINEVVFDEKVWRKETFLRRISYLKSLGFRIALDNLPIAKASFEKIKTISPHFIKLDRSKSEGLSCALDKQALITSLLKYILEYVHHSKMKLVLKGIETEEDLLTAKRLGVPLIQGNYISKSNRF